MDVFLKAIDAVVAMAISSLCTGKGFPTCIIGIKVIVKVDLIDRLIKSSDADKPSN